MTDNDGGVTAPHYTPNVVVSSPRLRRAAGWVLGSVSLVLGSAIVADGLSDAFDLSAWTVPIGGVVLFLSGAFGVSVTVPNVPR